MRRLTDEVYIADTPLVQVSAADIAWLQGLASDARRRRVRLCAHQQMSDAVHEMLIVLDRSTYVRPHRHRGKSESFHMIAGSVIVLLFDDDGGVRTTVRLGDYASGRPFYYRLSEPLYHAVLVETPHAVIHETTTGPFDPTAADFSPWSPPEEDGAAGLRYLQECVRS